MSVELLNESGWEVDEARIVRCVEFCLAALHVHPAAETSVALVDTETMERLHVQWLDLDGPTDVMSFPMDELRPGTPEQPTPAGLLGDVVLCPEVAAEQAREADHDFMQEVLLLTVHSVLHLLGYDHADESERTEMFTLQDDLLKEFIAADA
ncbi:rRNA maturation RNase YbeY [uncultured Agrococcus sp.]|uniref:rRNA maturation RNase YbeY n=1 Tax=uncultured Agrococcus sp. TaxID=382258 RepID=UPI0025E150A1|nr:rRNA maturation RNase YbeY [uncultured Agrococcus sp.]